MRGGKLHASAKATTTTSAEATAATEATATAKATRATPLTSATATAHTKATLTPATTAKDVQTIDEVNHTIAGNGVILGITTHGSGDGTADGALLVKDIVQLE